MMIKIEQNNVSLTFIPESKFMSWEILVVFTNRVSKDNVGFRKILPNILVESTKKYPSRLKLAKKLDDLYNASISAYTMKMGTLNNVCFYMQVLEDEYVHENISEEAIQLLHDVIYEPNIINNGFSKESVERIKHEFYYSNKQAKDSKEAICYSSFIKECFNDEPAFINPVTNLKYIKRVNEKNAYTYYQKMLQEDQVDIIVTGNNEKLIQLVAKVFQESHPKLSLNPVKEINRGKNTFHAKKTKTKQNDILIAYQGLPTYDSDLVMAASVFVEMLGGNPNSLLFTEIRERLGLCYSININYLRYFGIAFITAGISLDKLQLSLEAIDRIVRDATNLEKYQELLEVTKQSMIASLRKENDNAFMTIIKEAQWTLLGQNGNLEYRIKRIQDVTLEDIAKAITAMKKMHTEVLTEGSALKWKDTK